MTKESRRHDRRDRKRKGWIYQTYNFKVDPTFEWNGVARKRSDDAEVDVEVWQLQFSDGLL